MKSQNFLVCRSNSLSFQSQAPVNSRVLIRIPLDTEGFWEKIYNSDELIQKIVQDFKSENYIDVPDDYFLDFYFQNKTLKLDFPISSLLNSEIPTLYINQVVKKKPLKFIPSMHSPFPEFIGIPFSNPFEVFLFSREDSTLEIQLYDENIINNLFLNEFCPSSAYCNGNNHLFISGGERNNGELIDNLWEIDLKEQNIAEPTKIIPKKNHGMIFIPDKYIFIIGGNDKKCIYFNNETAEVEDWDNLNIIRTEPALCLVKNILYCFDSDNYRNNRKFTIEKTDLDSLRPKWELLEPKMNMILGNYITLEQQNFGVAKDGENNIIFVGGNMRDKKQKFNYKYNTKENMIELTKIPFNNYKLKEKNFFPLKQNIDFILPAFDKDNPQVIFFMKNKNKIELINYTQNQPENKTKIPGSDYKYDFNMPKIAIPDPISSYNFETDNIIGNKNLSNSNQEINGNNNIINTNINNVNLNKNNINNIKKPTIFQEPQIEPAKEDLKLSLEYQNNNLLINNLKDSQINKNGEHELNGSSIKENNQNDEIIINTNMNMNNLKKIDLSKDINMSGIIQGNNSHKLNGNINPNINIEEMEVKNSFIKHKKDDNENKNKINNISTDINIESSNINNNINISENSINPQVNINTQKSISTNTNANLSQLSKEINPKKMTPMIDYNLNGHIAGTKKTIYINNNKDKDKNKEIFKMSGIIKGTGKKQNVKQKAKETNININNKNINNKAKNKDNNDDIIKGVIPGNKPNSIQNEKKLSIPKLNLEGRIPDLSESDNNINNNISNAPHMIDLRGDNNTPSYEMNKNSPTFQLSLNRPKYDNTFELNGNNNNFSLNNGNVPGRKIDMSSFDNSNFNEIEIEQKNLGQRKIDLNNQKDVNIKANTPNKSINAKFDTHNENIIISGIIPGNQLSKHPFVNNSFNNNSLNNNSQKIIYDSNNNNIQNGNIDNNNLENNIYVSTKIPELKGSNNYNTGSNTYLLKNVGNNNNNNVFNKQYNKKNNNLPLVCNKDSNFISSKVEPIKNVDEENVDINNLKSSNTGVNGIKLGNRIIE